MFSTDTNNYLLLMASTDKIDNNFIFLYFNKFIKCIFCTPESKKWLFII